MRQPRIWGNLILTVDASYDQQSYVDAEGETYEKAKAGGQSFDSGRPESTSDLHALPRPLYSCGGRLSSWANI